MVRIKTLIHVHTDYSYDSSLSLDGLTRAAAREGIDCVAVTDHDTIEGALRLAATSKLKVIIGEEVSTIDGDVIGLFLKTRIKPGMSARETAIAIREQGGLVLVPHPFLRAFGCGLRDTVWDILDLVDAVEVNNGQNLVSLSDGKANRFAENEGLTKFVGSDTHMETSVAPCYQSMRDFDGPADFLDALRTAELTRGYHSLSYFAELARRVAFSYAKLPLPDCVGAHAEANNGRVSALAGLSAVQA